MAYMKTNPYTGQEYECACDYTYSCAACDSVREEFAVRKRAEERADWVIAAVKQIADHLGIELPVDVR